MKLNKDSFGGNIRGTFRGIKENEKVKKINSAISAQSEAIDKKLNFPKMLTGVVVTGAAIGIKLAAPIVPFMEVLFTIGITTMAAGLNIKLDRVKKGGKFWQNEKRIFDSITKGK